LTGSILGWADPKGTSDCADEVTLARKGVKSRRRITDLRSKSTKARTHVDRLRAANADLKKKLAESLEQQTASAEVLQVISSSPGELDRVFASILANATRICEANFANLALVQGGEFQMVAMHGAPRAFEDLRLRRDPKIPMGRPWAASSKRSGSSRLPTSPRKSLSPAQLSPSSPARVRLSASRCSKTTS
jgi:hypothetical protein